MSEIAIAIAEYLIPNWEIRNLISQDGCWVAIISDGEYVANASGGSIEEALSLACSKAERCEYVGRLSFLGAKAEDEPRITDLASLLGLGKSEPIKRRV